MINKDLIQSLNKLYPQIVTTRGDKAFDANGNEIAYDLAAVQAEAEAAEAAKQAAQNSATSKLKALGLTDDEISALKGTL
jgi:hypothetical protein